MSMKNNKMMDTINLDAIDKLITEGVELKKIAIETNDDELLEQMNEIGELVEEIIEEIERTFKE